MASVYHSTRPLPGACNARDNSLVHVMHVTGCGHGYLRKCTKEKSALAEHA